MKLVGGLIGGVIGGVIGAAIWAAIARFTGYEIGWVAWGVGGLVGMGVLIGSRQDAGIAGGVMAGVIALVAVLAGKYLVAYFLVGTVLATDDGAISIMADEVMAETAAQGNTRPMTYNEDAGSIEEYYLRDVWFVAEERFNELDEAGKELYRQRAERMYGNPVALFLGNFGLFGLVFLALAVFTAAKLGASNFGAKPPGAEAPA